MIVTNVNTSIGAVLFPRMAREQDKRQKVKEMTRLSIRFSSYFMSPMMFGLAAVAEPFVRLLLTDKWLPCVHLLQLFCIFYLFQPIQTANTQAIKAVGRSDLSLKLEIVRDLIQLVVLIAVMWVSVDAIVVSMAVMSVLFVFINAVPNIKLLNYCLKEQMLDIAPALGMSLIMSVIVCLIGMLSVNYIILLAIQIIAGATTYILLSTVTKNSEFKYAVEIAKGKLETLKLRKNQPQ